MAKRPNKAKAEPAAAILAMALEMADEDGWARVSLGAVAKRLEVSLDEIRRHYRDKDALANAWFAQAQREMLKASAEKEMQALSADQRLAGCLDAWFQALDQYPRASRGMLSGKLYFGHPHHWVPLVFDLSRFVHWLLDAADLNSPMPRRQVEEIGLSLLVLGAHRIWMRDPDEGRVAAGRFLSRNLARGGRIAGRVPARQ